jgi:hypothetical protein
MALAVLSQTRRMACALMSIRTRQSGKPHGFVQFVEPVIGSRLMAFGNKSRRSLGAFTVRPAGLLFNGHQGIGQRPQGLNRRAVGFGTSLQ